jgi:RNA polymerase sigma factor (sigma-70 family)
MQSPAGWTWIVARNAFRATRTADRKRADAHRRSTGAVEAAPAAMNTEVWDAIQRLPRRQREVIALRYLADLRERDIAELLAISPGTVARTLHDARGALATSLREEPHTEDRSG